MRRLVALLLAMLLCLAPAFAETKDRPPGAKGSVERTTFCDNVYSGCIKANCQDLPLIADAVNCANQCSGVRDSCNDARLGAIVDTLVDGLPLSTMAEEGLHIDLVEVHLGGIGKGRLAALCEDVPGAIFAASSASSYGCLHPNCNATGTTCTIVCAQGACTGFLPDRPPGKLNLIAILQNGDPINHAKPINDRPSKDPKIHDAG